MFERDHHPQEGKERVPMEVAHIDEQQLIPDKRVTLAIRAGQIATAGGALVAAGTFIVEETTRLLGSVNEAIIYDQNNFFPTAITSLILYMASAGLNEIADMRKEKANYIKNLNESTKREKELIRTAIRHFEKPPKTWF